MVLSMVLTAGTTDPDLLKLHLVMCCAPWLHVALLMDSLGVFPHHCRHQSGGHEFLVPTNTAAQPNPATIGKRSTPYACSTHALLNSTAL